MFKFKCYQNTYRDTTIQCRFFFLFEAGEIDSIFIIKFEGK